MNNRNLFGKNVYWGVFFIALTTLSWEILLTRIFSATMYYHFVFISISLAMLGFGCSGVIVFLFPRFFSREKCMDHLTYSSLLFSLTLVIAILSYLQVDSRFEPSMSTLFILFKIFFFIFLPYFFSGLTITLAIKHYANNVTTLYCYDLVGAGLGCSFIIVMLYLYDGISLVFFLSLLAALSSWLFTRGSLTTTPKKISSLVVLSTLCAFACNAHVYRFAKIQHVQGTPQNEILFEQWNPVNRVTASRSKIGQHKALTIHYDSTDQSTMIAFDGDSEKVSFLNNYLKSFYYQIKKDADVLTIGVGGGQDVLNAHINGHKRITAVEINPAIAKLNKETFRDFNGNLFHQPGIELIVDDGRNFIRHINKRFDIIQLGNVTSGVASASGAFTFVENSLYTVEAFKDYYHNLKEDGVLWFSQWRFGHRDQFFAIFRILTGVTKALEEMGVKNPENCIIVIEGAYRPQWRQAIILTKKKPFLAKEIRQIDNLRKKMNLVWLCHPARKINNKLNDFQFALNKQAFFDHYPFRIDPSTDDSPFFFNFLKPKHYIGKLPQTKTYFIYPVFMFKSLFIIIFVLVMLTIILPLLLLHRKLEDGKYPYFRFGYLFYFSCLGLGFMLVEIPLIQKFILFLGQPVYAIAVILSTLLAFSGMGSLLAGNFSQDKVHLILPIILLMLCFMLMVYIVGLPQVFNTFLGSPLWIRRILSVLLMLPLGIMMGMTFPLGIRLLNQDGPTMIPWVWGVNGLFSVMGSVIAWGLSLNFGYTTTLWTSSTIYGCAAIAMIYRTKASQRSTRGPSF